MRGPDLARTADEVAEAFARHRSATLATMAEKVSEAMDAFGREAEGVRRMIRAMDRVLLADPEYARRRGLHWRGPAGSPSGPVPFKRNCRRYGR